MKQIILLALLLFAINTVFSQTPDEIYREAYPEYTQTTDNSDFAILVQKLTDAKKSENKAEFDRYLNELKTKYSNRGNVSTGTPLPENRDYFLPTMTQPVEVGNLPDWANGENKIFSGSVGTSSQGNPNAYNRQVKIETDTMGNLYVAFMNSNKDSLFFYRSTNKGASWARIQGLYSGALFKYYSFDFAVADSTGGFKIGMVVSIAPTSNLYQGTVYYADMLATGAGFSPVEVLTPASGRGIIGPVICTDAYNWSAGSTYWYIAAQNCDASTGVTSFVPCVYTPNWGSTWLHDTARSSYNDYELDIDYNFDSIYVVLTNNLTAANENLRLRYTALGTWGTNVSWKQFNPAGESFPEYNACLAVNRKNNAMVVTYTTNESSNYNIKYSYAANGFTWVTHNMLSGQSNNETRSYIHSTPQQSGAFRVAYCSESSGFDTVVYMNTFDITSGFSSRTIVSRVNLSTGVLAPCVVGYMFNGITAGAGVVYAGNGPSNIWYNGSDITTEIAPVSGIIPDRYILSQNYPNPFNPVTKINFAITGNNKVTLKVYDVVGKEVAVLVNQNLSSGEYQITFDGTKLASGVYFYKLTAGEFTGIRKMILVK
ncbi:MAG: T9SS type A sorting domain-containing protein [Ignavibacteriae bacterium]|nr:T9SS type A sorting domain-containing protein [Ignavibacteriota bacterium]